MRHIPRDSSAGSIVPSLGLLVASVLFAGWMTIDSVEAGPVKVSKAQKLAADHKPISQQFADYDKAPSPSFRRHVLPLFSRVGCNGRACHGSFQGRGGFQLSLFGYDFQKDHKALFAKSDNYKRSRIDLEDPESSLIMEKPTMTIKHEGKQVIDEDTWQFNLMKKWIADGAKEDSNETGTFGRLEVFPKEIVANKVGEQIKLRVVAHWQDGDVEEVTDITRFRTNDESIAEIDKDGVVTIKGKGDTHVVAFYDNGVAPVPVMLAVSDKVGKKYPKVVTRTEVDELIVKKLRKVGIVPSDVCTDAEFLRRVSLDLTGSLPTPAEVEAFLKDTSKNKRNKKIDELLKSDAYAAWWTTKLCDWTGNNSNALNSRYFRDDQSRQWYDWVYKRVAENEPYDKIIEGFVLAVGRSSPDQSYMDYAKQMSSYHKEKNAADFTERPNMPHYWMRRNMRRPEEKALNFAYAFLGVRLECAQCHKHPFDQWTQQDFQSFQAFFTPIYAGTPPDGREQYKQMQDDIAKKVGYSRDIKDAKEAQKRRRMMQEEEKRRVLAGEPVPWIDLYVREPKKLSKSQLERLKKQKKNGNIGRVITPKVLGGEEIVDGYRDPREPLMDWLRNNNPYFAKAFVNRVWANHFGRGIIDPPDDLNLANPPSNAPLLDYLATGFEKSGFDMKWLHREILASDAYQRSWKPNETNLLDKSNFSRMIPRRMPAEIMVDALTAATAAEPGDVRDDIDNRNIGRKAGSYRGARSSSGYALSIFGKPMRETICDCERTNDPTLLQTVFVRNDRDLYTMLDRKGGWIDSLRRAERENAKGKKEVDVDTARADLRRKIAQAGNKLSGSQKRKYIEKFDKKYGKGAFYAKPKPKAKTVKITKDTEAMITQVFLRTVSRLPSKDEMHNARLLVAETGNEIDGIRELLWTMLNTKEFAVNH